MPCFRSGHMNAQQAHLPCEDTEEPGSAQVSLPAMSPLLNLYSPVGPRSEEKPSHVLRLPSSEEPEDAWPVSSSSPGPFTSFHQPPPSPGPLTQPSASLWSQGSPGDLLTPCGLLATLHSAQSRFSKVPFDQDLPTQNSTGPCSLLTSHMVLLPRPPSSPWGLCMTALHLPSSPHHTPAQACLQSTPPPENLGHLLPVPACLAAHSSETGRPENGAYPRAQRVRAQHD